MYIKLSKDQQYKFEQLVITKELNMFSADFFLDFLLDNQDLPVGDISKEQYIKYLCEKSEFGVDDNQKQFIKDYISPALNKYDTNDFETNDYNSLIIIKEIIYKNYILKYDTIKKNELFPYNDISVDENHNFKEISSIGFFSTDYKYISLYQNDTVWMNITPNEINTMKPYIDKAHGNVITFGLGLGYYAFMVSNKQNVESVTIVENDQDIIDIFKQYLLPQFPNKDKIKIVKNDALTYNPQLKFDYAFVDLWHNANDGLELFIKMKQREHLYNCSFNYWLEEALIALVRRCYISLYQEQIDRALSSQYFHAKNIEDNVINALFFLTKNEKITDISQVISSLSSKNISKLIYKLSI